MADSRKEACKYGVDCYQRNEAHLNRFSHPPKVSNSEQPAADDQPRPHKRESSRSPNSLPSEKKPKIADSSESDSSNSLEKVELSNTDDSQSNDTDRSKNDGANKSDAETSTAKATEASEHGPDRSHDINFISKCFDRGSCYSQRAEHEKLLESPAAFIKDKFLVEMPADFYAFWAFCQSEAKNRPPETILDKFGLHLVGPFDVLAKKFDKAELFEPADYLRHWRFYYDPPEFQTILVKEKSGIHYGYWRDDPPNGSCLIARNDADSSCEFNFIADNIFGAVLHFLEKDTQLTPFNRSSALAMKKSLEDYALDKKISLTSFSGVLKARNVKTVCKTFHKGGLVVPFDRKTDVGYRQLSESDANLKKILNRFIEAKGDRELIKAAMDKLQPLITAADIACDESDFGNSIELGIDLFSFGAAELHNIALQLLVNGYSMVNKPQFIAIIKAHLEKRSKGHSLSILSPSESSSK